MDRNPLTKLAQAVRNLKIIKHLKGQMFLVDLVSSMIRSRSVIFSELADKMDRDILPSSIERRIQDFFQKVDFDYIQLLTLLLCFVPHDKVVLSIECFKSIEDPRKSIGLRTPLPALLSMLVMSYMSGFTGYRASAKFMKGNKKSFIKMFKLKHPPIGHTQLRTVLKQLDFRAINKAFFKWINSFVSIEEGEWLSGDGKTLCSTVIDAHGNAQDFELMVRLFSQKLEIVTHTATTKNKSSEIKAMQNLLKTLETKGVIITLDALHCQKKTLDIIVQTGNTYVIEVKANQKKLFQHLKTVVEKNQPIDTHYTEEKNRGRLEKRHCEIYDQVQGLDSKWNSVKCIIYIRRSGNRPKTGDYLEDHYYISGHPFKSACDVAIGIRKHWGIENKIHYVKDTHFNEDKNRIRDNSAAAILSTFQDMAINLYRCLGYSSLKTGTIYFANKVNELFTFLNKKHINYY